MRRIISFIRRHSYPLLFTGIAFILFIANYVPGTFLTGWDNLQTDLNPTLGITRAFFGVWQEYQSMGLISGLAHASDLIRAAGIAAVSLIIPMQFVRYSFHIAMLAIGGIGMFVFLTQIGLHGEKKYAAMTGGLFYMLNLGTIQIFSLPWESFSVFFAVLPWILRSIVRILTAIPEAPKKEYALFLGIAVLATPLAYIETVFIVYMAVIALFCIGMFAAHPAVRTVKRSLVLIAGVLIVNAFWLLPELYAFRQVSDTARNSSINVMSTNDTFLKNRQKGTLDAFMRLEGFYYDTVNSRQQPVFDPWKQYNNNPLVAALPYVFMTLAIIGIISMRKYRWPVFFVWMCTAVALMPEAPGFAWVNGALRHSGTINELFRSPFTKFVIPHALAYSISLGFGAAWIISKIHKHFIFPKWFLIAAAYVTLLAYAFPAFGGNLFNSTVRSPIPDEYFRLMAYMKTQPADTRIALLPEPAIWGWYWERFGYDGSGFLWYGIRQPIISRTFDPWSRVSENYYWELTRALYGNNAQDVLTVFRKYGVSYVLLDGNLRTATSGRALFTDQIRQMLGTVSGTGQRFGNLTLYKLPASPASFVSVRQLPDVYPAYSWTDNDAAYRDTGGYIAQNKVTSGSITYPFRSLFTKRMAAEREFSVTEDDTSITISSASVATRTAILKKESLAFDSDVSGLSAKSVIECGELEQGATSVSNIWSFNGTFIHFDTKNQKSCLSFGAGSLLHKDGYLVAVESRHVQGKPLLLSIINETARHVEVETYLPENTEWNETYFILPPLAPDGLGYSFYVTNDSIGSDNTVNDLKRIRIYSLPYADMVQADTSARVLTAGTETRIPSYHPNPAYYAVTLDGAAARVNTAPGLTQTIILSQSYDRGWLAVTPTAQFPYFKTAGRHVLVNNWENGWALDAALPGATTVYLVFWPQVLEYIGFLLLPLPFLFVLRKKHRTLQ